MSSLLGVELPTPVNFVIAFVFVLLLIGAAAWLVRRFGATNIDPSARGRQPRLAVIDSAAVDGRRKLVIIRRDNVEHLLMIGGPSDVVVETNIVRAAAVATRDAPAARNGDAATRAMPLPDPTPWPLQPEPALAPTPAVQPQPARAMPRAADDVWPAPAEPVAAPAPEVRAVRSADTLAGLAEELGRPEHIIPTRAAPPQRIAAPAVNAPQTSAAADQSLAEMAQRLEAALRRPMAQKIVGEGQRVTATVEIKAAAPRAATVPPKVSAPTKGNLEQEMASLLSRPGKT